MNISHLAICILSILLVILILKYWAKGGTRETWGNVVTICVGGIGLILAGIAGIYAEIMKLF